MGHYVTTENYKLFYNMEGGFTKMVALEELSHPLAQPALLDV